MSPNLFFDFFFTCTGVQVECFFFLQINPAAVAFTLRRVKYLVESAQFFEKRFLKKRINFGQNMYRLS